MPTTTTRFPFVMPAEGDHVKDYDAALRTWVPVLDAALWKYRGDWSSLTSFAVNDVTVSKGLMYLCLIANSNSAPETNYTGATPKWKPFAATVDTVCLAYRVAPLENPLTAGVNKLVVPSLFAFTLTSVYGWLEGPSTSGDFVMDLNLNGTSVLGATKLTVDANENHSSTSASATSISTTAILGPTAELSVDIDDNGTGAYGAWIQLNGYVAFSPPVA